MKPLTENLRASVYARDIYDISHDFISAENEPRLSGNYFGEVIDNNDPLKKGRVRVRVYTLFPDNIPTADIPWAIPDFAYAGSIKGSFIVPPTGTRVRVYFDHEDIYCPVYEAKGYHQDDLPDGISTNYPDTMILYSTDSGEYYSVNRKTNATKLKIAGTIAIGNQTTELLDVVSQIMALLLSSVTATSLGPQPLSNCIGGTASPVGLLKAKLDAIKGTI